jgi:Peptidoglycan-binding protein, CsiV
MFNINSILAKKQWNDTIDGMIKQYRIICLVLLSVWLCLWAGAAEADNYQIEIIIFSHITEAGLRSEYWPALPPQSISAKAIELPAAQLGGEADWQLKTLHESLKRNHYPVLLHWNWQESADSLRQGQLIHLTGGNHYEDNLWQVNGTLFIRLEHYFNIHFNLRFFMPWLDIQDMNLANFSHNNEETYFSFKMNERLRIRSNELNYIDHPLYGILMKITPMPSSVSIGLDNT